MKMPNHIAKNMSWRQDSLAQYSSFFSELHVSLMVIVMIMKAQWVEFSVDIIMYLIK